MRVDLPVGENLQDHLMCQLNYETTVPSLFEAMTPENIALLEQEGRGPLTSNIPEAGAFFRTRAGLRAPDVEFHYAPSLLYDEGLVPPHDNGYLLRSRGDQAQGRRQGLPALAPARRQAPMLHNYLTEDEDRQSMIAGIRLALDIATKSPLAELLRAPYRVPDGDSDEAILDFVKATPRPSTTRPRAARSARSSIATCASRASRACASSTPR